MRLAMKFLFLLLATAVATSELQRELNNIFLEVETAHPDTKLNDPLGRLTAHINKVQEITPTTPRSIINGLIREGQKLQQELNLHWFRELQTRQELVHVVNKLWRESELAIREGERPPRPYEETVQRLSCLWKSGVRFANKEELHAAAKPDIKHYDNWQIRQLQRIFSVDGDPQPSWPPPGWLDDIRMSCPFNTYVPWIVGKHYSLKEKLDDEILFHGCACIYKRTTRSYGLCVDNELFGYEEADEETPEVMAHCRGS